MRKRLAGGDLRAVRAHGEHGVTLVRFVPYEDWLRVDDAAGLLSVATSTLRAAAQRGELAGRRDRETHRWQVKLLAVLEDRRCNPAAVQLFTGQQPEPETELEEVTPARRPRVKHDVFFRVDEDDYELVQRARGRHGSYAAAIVLGLRAIDDDAIAGAELAEIRAASETHREALERERAAHAALRDRARGRLVDELYCPACERLVAIEEIDVVDVDDGQELYHRPHGHRAGGKLRQSTVAARRKSESSTT